MLEILRKKGVNKTILWIIAIVIILSFGIFGTAYRVDNILNSAGTLYGRSVSIKDFQRAYYDARDQAIRTYGEEYFKNGNRLDMEQETWDRLMLLKEAENRDIRVTDQEIVAFIAAVPFFQRNGQFDQSLYEAIVQNPNLFDRPTHDFEEGVRKQLMIKKLMDAVAPDLVQKENQRQHYRGGLHRQKQSGRRWLREFLSA